MQAGEVDEAAVVVEPEAPRPSGPQISELTRCQPLDIAAQPQADLFGGQTALTYGDGARHDDSLLSLAASLSETPA